MSSQSTGDYFQYDAQARLYKWFTWDYPSNQHYHKEWMPADWQPTQAHTVIPSATPHSSALPASASQFSGGRDRGDSIIAPVSYSHAATSAGAAAPYVAPYANFTQYGSSSGGQQHGYSSQYPNVHANTALPSYYNVATSQFSPGEGSVDYKGEVTRQPGELPPSEPPPAFPPVVGIRADSTVPQSSQSNAIFTSPIAVLPYAIPFQGQNQGYNPAAGGIQHDRLSQRPQSDRLSSTASPQGHPHMSPALGTAPSRGGLMPRGRGGKVRGTYRPHSNTPHFERVDHSYYVRGKAFFFEGRVFSVIMNETAGSNSTEDATDYNSSPSINTVKFQDNFVHTSIRRFIVVRQKREFCYACPIFTYSGRATTKRGVRPSEHGIAYSWGSEPQLIPGEGGMTKPSIAVVMAEGTPNLNVASRIYYGIIHPIQYNVKVKEVGYIPKDHIPYLISNWKSGDESSGQDGGGLQDPEVLIEEDEEGDGEAEASNMQPGAH